eukprot:5134470-Pyramimonas_sp.AAC.1
MHSSFDAAEFRETSSAPEHEIAKIDPSLRESFQWVATQGTRYKRADRVVSDSWLNYVFVCLCVAMEPTRYLTLWFMAASNKVRSFVGYPPLMDLLYEPASPLIWCLQYLSSCVRGDTTRCRLLQRQCAAHAVWVTTCPTEARLARRLLMHQIGQIEMRH